MTCTSGCRTKDHASYSECLKSKNPKVSWSNEAKRLDKTADKAWEKELNAYADARRQGTQPRSTSLADTRQALDISDQTGTAFRA